MKKHLLFFGLIGLIVMPSFSSAEINVSTSASTEIKSVKERDYEQCKKNALSKKEKVIASALQEYRTASDQVTNRAKLNFEVIAWRVPSSYRSEVAKILAEKKKAMVSITARIEQTRKTAQETWKVEDALCEFKYTRGTATSTKEIGKKHI